MDPQEDAGMPGAGQVGQRHCQTPAEALTSLTGIDYEPRDLQLCFVVIDP
jgi:hypothetical protein